MKKLRVALLAVLVMSIYFLSSFSSETKPLKNGDKWIPSDFDVRKSTILVQPFVWHNKYKGDVGEKRTEEMKEEMKANYPYKYEFASEEDIRGGSKYADKDKYRYALMWSNGSYAPVFGRATASNSGTVFDFHIYDRKLDKHYPATGKYASFIMTIFKPTVATIVEFMKNLK